MSPFHQLHQTETSGRRHLSCGFTLPEVLVVAGVIAVLIAVLLPALYGALRTANMAGSQNNLRQIATWMRLYSGENREFIVPSQFDYTASAAAPLNFPVKVRSNPALAEWQYKGTWTDILWTVNGLSIPLVDQDDPGNVQRYQYDSPDAQAYESTPGYDGNPLRAAAANSQNFPGGTGPKPYGTGAQEYGLPGFFAANDFFNARPDAPVWAGSPPTPTSGRWWTTGQIKAPERSLYVVDSFAGEIIEPLEDGPFETYRDAPASDPATVTLEVDFRYNGVCLMLFLDGHSSPEAPWDDLSDLQGSSRRIKVQKLH